MAHLLQRHKGPTNKNSASIVVTYTYLIVNWEMGPVCNFLIKLIIFDSKE